MRPSGDFGKLLAKIHNQIGKKKKGKIEQLLVNLWNDSEHSI